MVRELFRHIPGIEAHQLFGPNPIYLSPDTASTLTAAARKIVENTPLQYVLGKAYFYDLELCVTPDVLIPRPETEELVRWALEQPLPPSPRILDAGTGSGCIAIALARNTKGSCVYALDISEKALKVASSNAVRAGVCVRFYLHNILNLQPVELEGYPFHLVVSNPPYVCQREAVNMQPNVLNHEPHNALFVPDNDPLVFYSAIASQAHWLLVPGGTLMFEINEGFGQQTVKLLEINGFAQVELRKDINGKDRMVKGVWQ